MLGSRMSTYLLAWCFIISCVTLTDAISKKQQAIQTRTWDQAIALAKQFVAQLTLEEKCNMTAGVKGHCVGNVLPISRLNFNGMCFQDAPSGVGDGAERATAFPAGIQTAATWDRNLFFQRGVAIGEEFRGKGIHFALGPMMNIDRNARHGRNWEGFGSDPYLSGENAFYYVQGVQDQGVVATAKHYICNEQETHRSSLISRGTTPKSNETNAKPYSANVNDKTIHEIYLWPFASSVAAGAGSVMCAYNRVNGTAACQNKRTLSELLKGELAFPGNVMSDWGATRSGVDSAMNGLDIDMPGGDGYMGMSLLPAVKQGTIPESRIDDMITRIMAPYYLVGQDQGFPTVDLARDVLSDHYQINREVSRAGMILLKNVNNTLPFNVTTDVLFSVFGEAASRAKHGFGGDGALELGGAIYEGGGSGYVEPTYAIDPLTALLAKARDNHLQIRYITDQLGYEAINASLKVEALGDAKCIVFISSFSTEGVDRYDLHPANGGDTLVKTVASNCKKTIVIVNSVSQLDIEAWIDEPNIVAVIWSGMPGPEYGPALVDILFGDYNPGGKLVFTLAKREADYGTEISPTENSDYREGVFLDYRHFDKNRIVPRYYFGFGLSYTTFSFAQLIISKASHNRFSASEQFRQRLLRPYTNFGTSKLFEPVYEITFRITNTGKVYGSEVPQLYLEFPAEADEPPKVLRGFERVYLAAGETKQVSMVLTQRDVSYWNVITQKWTMARGTYQVWISTSANNSDRKLQSSFTI